MAATMLALSPTQATLLAPGPFAPFKGVEVGRPARFSNDIYSLECFPLHAQGRVLLWVVAAHESGGRVFVETCDETLDSTQDTRPGAKSDWWFEATLVDGAVRPRIRLRRLPFPDWTYFSNPEPCGSNVAYWAYVSGRLRAVVGDLLTGRVLAQRELGQVAIETDNPGAFELAVWDTACGSAIFSGKRYGLPDVRVPR